MPNTQCSVPSTIVDSFSNNVSRSSWFVVGGLAWVMQALCTSGCSSPARHNAVAASVPNLEEPAPNSGTENGDPEQRPVPVPTPNTDVIVPNPTSIIDTIPTTEGVPTNVSDLEEPVVPEVVQEGSDVEVISPVVVLPEILIPHVEGGAGLIEGSETSNVIDIDAMDMDGDGWANIDDNCSGVSNSDQSDVDHDGLGDACDNCKAIANAAQKNSGKTLVGDACRFTSLALSTKHSCGINEEGHAVCWGDPSFGKLKAPKDLRFVQIAAGSDFTCGITAEDRTVVCWGNSKELLNAPDDHTRYTSIAAGLFFACAIKEKDQSIMCWGIDTQRTTPPSGKFKTLTAGFKYACALDAKTGLSTCWGGSPDGEITFSLADPKNVTFSVIVSSIDHRCGIKADDGAVVCWGENSALQSTPPVGYFDEEPTAIIDVNKENTQFNVGATVDLSNFFFPLTVPNEIVPVR